jgi:hypothetical protein
MLEQLFKKVQKIPISIEIGHFLNESIFSLCFIKVRS